MNEADLATLNFYRRRFGGYWRVIDSCVDGWLIDSKGMTLGEALDSVIPS